MAWHTRHLFAPDPLSPTRWPCAHVIATKTNNCRASAPEKARFARRAPPAASAQSLLPSRAASRSRTSFGVERLHLLTRDESHRPQHSLLGAGARLCERLDAPVRRKLWLQPIEQQLDNISAGETLAHEAGGRA
eukprot:scaffold105683_cov27-Tisochrysis_lutea.AAC.2